MNQSNLSGPITVPVKNGKPAIGFAGIGWIGKHRMEAIVEENAGRVTAVCDPQKDVLAVIAEQTGASIAADFNQLLSMPLQGIAIATPSALHKEQAIQALNAGKAVFCQKPLARTAADTLKVLEAAKAADKLLQVDFSYRHTAAVSKLKSMIAAGDLGEIYAADLIFHNAYGPDKPWYYDPRQAGGGCVADLGVHLADMIFWLMGDVHPESVNSQLYYQGKPVNEPEKHVEDFATASIRLNTGAAISLACSWHAPAGKDAIIEARFYGTKGGAAVRNVDGSFFDFRLERFHGNQTEVLVNPPDDWGGRAAVAWAQQLAESSSYDASAEIYLRTANLLDQIYGRNG